jgi:group I intron endonuclease
MVIYKTTNLLNGKFYIGKDEKNNPNYLGSGLYLKRAVKKYGIESFKKEIIEICPTREELNIREKYWIETLSATTTGYNIAEGGTGGKTTPVVHNKGKTYEELYGVEKAKELKEKKRLATLGKKLTDDVKEKIREGNKGKKVSDETKLKQSNANKGKKVSDETKQKISKSVSNFFLNEENRKKMSDKHKGKVLSDETKHKISESVKKCKNK